MKAPTTFVLAAAVMLATSCANEVGTLSGGTGTGGSSGSGGAGACGSSQIDLLLMVDNSPSIAEKQQLLAAAIPALVSRLANPPCLDATGNPVTTGQPSGPLGACPVGSARAQPPVLDMHIGLLSSSLGSFGTPLCPETPPAACAGTPTTISNDDHGHLVTRTDPCGTTSVPTYQSEGFLAWDPAQKLTPPGESALGDPGATPPTPGLSTSLQDLVLGDGSDGCVLRSQNESWYRFLVDPTPYASISIDGAGQVQTTGVDMTLLQQRKEFLRPGSMLVIVTVSDRDDSSVKEYGPYPEDLATKGGVLAFGVVDDLHMAGNEVELFYPPSRYSDGLTASTVLDADGDTVPNPIYSNLDPSHYTGAVRDPSRVFYATVTGVPWQLIARQKNGVPDLVNGVSTLDPTQVGGFKTSAELALLDGEGNSFWDDIAGDPESYVPARSPFMQESSVPRIGTDPITGIAISPPGSTPGNPINGNEWNIPVPADDLEYACIFPLLQARDCSAPTATECSCFDVAAASDNPLCAPNPNDDGNPTLQVDDKAYPGLKHLAIAHDMGDQGIVASICAAQITDSTGADYGYQPAMKTIGDVIADRLRSSTCGE